MTFIFLCIRSFWRFFVCLFFTIPLSLQSTFFYIKQMQVHQPFLLQIIYLNILPVLLVSTGFSPLDLIFKCDAPKLIIVLQTKPD